MNALNTAKQHWLDRDVESSNLPGAGGVGFGKATSATAAQLNKRITAQMEDVNQRLYDLEKQVFKPDEPGNEREE